MPDDSPFQSYQQRGVHERGDHGFGRDPVKLPYSFMKNELIDCGPGFDRSGCDSFHKCFQDPTAEALPASQI